VAVARGGGDVYVDPGTLLFGEAGMGGDRGAHLDRRVGGEPVSPPA
jgi:hypothetical protein